VRSLQELKVNKPLSEARTKRRVRDMSTVLRAGEPPKAVKNLGWILRHWAEVEWLGFNYAPDNKRMIAGEFVAKLKDGTTYISEYASLSVFWHWVNRPVFKGVTLRLRINYDGPTREFIIGDAEYKRIDRLPYKEQMAAILAMP
jgi:hypothetical protein